MNYFDIDDAETIKNILLDHEVDLYYEPLLMVDVNGKYTPIGDPHWGFTSKHGSWQTPYYNKNEKNKAETFAALFYYLWDKGVGLPLSDQLTSAYLKSEFS